MKTKTWTSAIAALVLCSNLGGQPAEAVSVNFKDVCSSGCSYPSVQAAINSITDSSATNVYTVFVDAGVHNVSTSITFDGKSYINLVGRGMGASILRATSEWFAASGDLVNLTNSTHIVVRGLTIDAKTNDNGTNSTANSYTAVRTDGGDALLFDSCEILATSYGFWEGANSAGRHVEVRNSVVRAAYLAMYLQTSASWHIYSSDIRAVKTGTNESLLASAPVAIQISGGANTPVTLWGSHVHAESSYAGMAGVGMAAVRLSSPGARFVAVGSTLHVKLLVDPDLSGFGVQAFLLDNPASGPSMHFVGTDLLYETPANITRGRVSAIGYRGNGINGSNFALDNAHLVDLGGSGGERRSDIISIHAFGQTIQPRFRMGAVHSTQNPQKGTITLSSGSALVTLTPTQADQFYTVLLTSSTTETLSVSSKSTTQFTISSTNGSSTAIVDYVVVR